MVSVFKISDLDYEIRLREFLGLSKGGLQTVDKFQLTNIEYEDYWQRLFLKAYNSIDVPGLSVRHALILNSFHLSYAFGVEFRNENDTLIMAEYPFKEDGEIDWYYEIVASDINLVDSLKIMLTLSL